MDLTKTFLPRHIFLKAYCQISLVTEYLIDDNQLNPKS